MGSTQGSSKTSTSQTSARLCVRCGARLASDNASRVCTCHVNRYDPRCDGQWPQKLRAYVAQNVGGTIHPTAHFGIVSRAKYCVARSIHTLAAQGWSIRTVPGRDCYHIDFAPRTEDACAIVDAQAETANEESETPSP